MRRSLVLAALAVVVVAGGAAVLWARGGGPPWVGRWTLDHERTAASVAEFEKAERARMRATMGGTTVGAPKGRDPTDAEMLEKARGWVKGIRADLDLRDDGGATADLYFGGVPVRYTGTWSESPPGAEMRIASRADGLLQARDSIPVRFVREGEYLVLGGEKDATGRARSMDEVNTVIPFRRMYLSRK